MCILSVFVSVHCRTQYCVDVLQKGMNPSLLPLATDKIVQQNNFSNIARVIG